MQPTDDSALLRQYADSHSDEAFAALVERYINLVYSVALRLVGNPHTAEEIAQAVFIILAKKAPGLRHEKALSSWLFQTTRLTANNFIRSEIRRRDREQEAYMRTILEGSTDGAWLKIAPMLDSAVAALQEKDRRAVLLRFYEGRNLRDIGSILGAGEAAAEKRVNRAVEKLRKLLAKRNVNSTAAIIAAAISTNAVQAAPMALAKSVTAVALTKGATTPISTLTLIKGAMKLMAWTKAKTGVAVGLGALLVAGTATVTIKTIAAHHIHESWRTLSIQPAQLDQLPPEVAILPTAFSRWAGSKLLRPGIGIDKFVGINVPVAAIASLAYRGNDPLGMPWPRTRMIFTTTEPPGRYDFVATLAHGSQEALREKLQTTLGVVGHYETRDTDALVLRAKNSGARQLTPVSGDGYGNFNDTFEHGQHHFKGENQPLSIVTGYLEREWKTPVIDQTGLRQHFNIDLSWEDRGGQEALKAALLEQLGLELVPAREPVEMLVLEQVK
jgi:RNA polymerase sigma factor (sigma-70 family)